MIPTTRPPGYNFSPTATNVILNNGYPGPNCSINQIFHYISSPATVQHDGQMGNALNNQSCNLLSYGTVLPTTGQPVFGPASTAVSSLPTMSNTASAVLNVPNQSMTAHPMQFQLWPPTNPVIPDKQLQQNNNSNGEQNSSILEQRLTQNDTTSTGMALLQPQSVAEAPSAVPQVYCLPTPIINQIILCLDDDLYKKVTDKALAQFKLEQSQTHLPRKYTKQYQNKKKLMNTKSINDLEAATSKDIAVIKSKNKVININTIKNYKDEGIKKQQSANGFVAATIEHMTADCDELSECEEKVFTINDSEDQRNSFDYSEPVIKANSRRDKGDDIIDVIAPTKRTRYIAISNNTDKVMVDQEKSVTELGTANSNKRVADDNKLSYNKNRILRVELRKEDIVDIRYVRKVSLNSFKNGITVTDEKHKSGYQSNTTQNQVKHKAEENITMQHRTTIADQMDESLDNEDKSGFAWTPDFYTFRGEKEKYFNNPQSTTDSILPYELFSSIWDIDMMTHIAKLTNENLCKKCKPKTSSICSSPRDDCGRIVDIDELYTLFAILIYMGLSERNNLTDYWLEEALVEMPVFGSAMSMSRFLILNKCLKFPSSIPLKGATYDDIKISEVVSIVDHCNNKFKALYVPQQCLTIDQSMILQEHCVSKLQSERSLIITESNIKWYHLCEARTGYMLKCKLHSENGESLESHHFGFDTFAEKVVLNLIEDYLDAGHHLSMDSSFNSLPLTRYLKQRRTDVIGTIKRNAPYIPKDIQNLTDKTLPLHDYVTVHCGDISLAVWRDQKIECLVSTYHDDSVAETHQPDAYGVVKDFNDTMCGINYRDNMISKYINKPKNTSWHIAVLKRLLNYSLLNIYIIREKNLGKQVACGNDFDNFRYAVAYALIDRHKNSSLHLVPRNQECKTPIRSLHVNHIPDYFANSRIGKLNKKLCNVPAMRVCVQCVKEGRRTMVDTICQQCDLSVCLGECWAKWHNIKIS